VAVSRPEPYDAAPYDAAGAKFAAPLAARLISRPRLHDRLEAGLRGPVTLLSTPAGWGKTLLVGSWLSVRPPDRPFVWITLAAADDDPRAFWRTVGTGLAGAVGEPAATALRGMDAVTVAELPGLVAGVLDATGPVLVVLDNLHELRSASVHEGLLHLIDRPPPGLHLVVTTREDPPWPLDRMRLTGGLCELRSPELALSEVASFAVDLAHRTRGQEPRPAAAALVEPLTTREQVVLRYLASALSNAEIAAELYVSVNTVKTHQRTIYRKLAAEGRRDAVRRARELQLL
jgi:ATP/maltotriose-dependent transcriptional regulator MalT